MQIPTTFMSLLGLSTISFLCVLILIPIVAKRLPAKLSGKDLCKKGTPAGDIPIPEALGIVSGLGYVVFMLLTVLFLIQNDIALQKRIIWGIVCIFAMLLLGIFDDLSDLRWRHKLLYPTLASLPLLVNYTGGTSIVLPKPVHFLFSEHTFLYSILSPWFPISNMGEIIDIGVVYYVYMGLMAVFCTNAINIYAGINGLEAGQSLIIGLAVVIQNIIQIQRGHDNDGYHYLSLLFMVPFVFTTMGLLRYNMYPSSVFVGDTFCYYAGMTFAVVGILGHFSKTLILFFLPQVLNFIYSLPQLFKFVPCPRHRLPKFNNTTGLLEPSCISSTSTRSNFTVLNLMLLIFGPMKEVNLVLLLFTFQIFCCAIAFYIRYGLSSYFYDVVN